MKLTHPSTRRSIRTLFFILLMGLFLFGLLFQSASVQADSPNPFDGAATGDAPGWLLMFEAPHQLYSEYDLDLLAGRLILFGVVNGQGCPNGGLLDDGHANDCGMERARPVMVAWQNRFNAAIIAASEQTGVPPILLKNIFAWESQFWPQTIFVNTSEYGLGHLTYTGADSVLRWNYAFYQKTCRATFSAETCDKFYGDQPENIRAALRGVVIQHVNADCGNCAYGLDLQLAENSIPVFANTLLANTSLVKLYVQRYTGKPAVDVVAYEDLWKFTLASYNAGPGCFKSALARTYYARQKLDWENLSSNLDLACQGAIAYVDFVGSTDQYHPDHAPTLEPTPTLTEITPTSTPAVSATVEATSTFEATATTSTSETPIEISATPEVPVSETPTPTLEPFTATVTASATETSTATPVAPDPIQDAHSDQELVVKFHDFPASLFSNIVLNSVGATVVEEVDSLGVLVVSVPADQLPAVLDQLNNNLLVDYAEPNYFAQAFYTPNDPDFIQQSDYLTAMQVPAAWDVTRGNGVIVALIDTGVDVAHADLSNNIWINAGETGLDAAGNDKHNNGLDDDGNGYVDDWQGWNFVAGTNNVLDDQGHGTLLAGIIAAQMDNAAGLAGIAPQARVMALKALNASGQGTYADVAAALTYAVDNGARIVNLGFGGAAQSDVLRAAIDYAEAHGVLVVAAAGNTGSNQDVYPAAYPNVISVAAVDNTLNWASFSTYGAHTSLVAPGVGIYSALPGGYGAKSGTSMSSAQVAGMAALLATQPQFDSAAKLRAALLGSALDLGAPGWDEYYGSGLVRALDAVNYVPGSTATPTASPSPTNTLDPNASPTPTVEASPTSVDGGVSIMAVASGSAWTNINATSPNNQNGTITSTGTFTAGAGTNRILLVAVIGEINTGVQAMTTLTATYGGVPLTLLASTHTTANREHVWVGYLLDSQIPAGAQNVQVTYNTGSATNTLGALDIKVATYVGVDQITPFNGSNANVAAGATVATNAAINYVANGMTFFVAGNGGTPATNAITATPALTTRNSNTSGSQTSIAGDLTTPPHAANGTYASGGISITFGGTTSAWSALVVGTLNPAPPVAAGTAWTNINATSPGNQSGVVTSTNTFTAGAGSNRILLVAVICEINTGVQTMTTLSATYGGVPLTMFASTHTTANREHVWVGYLLDSQIPAGVQNVVVTYDTGSAANTLASLDIKTATYTGVNQTMPFNGSNANVAAGTTVATNAAINYVANGITFFVAGNGGTPATNAITATPGLTTRNSNTSGSQTSIAGDLTTAPHTANGMYASGGISITFGGTTSARSALVVGTLNPAPVATVPVLTSPTAPYATVTDTTATLGATITSQGASAITARGTCWGTTAAPTTNCVAESGTATGLFTQARTGLPAGTLVYYRGYANNASGRGYSPDGSFYTEPATQASGVNFTAVGMNSMTVNWTRGSGNGVIVLMKAVSAITGIPADGTYTTYVPNTVFGSGTLITDAYVIYKGTGTSVTVTGLAQGTTYYVAVYEYAGAVDTAGVNQGTNYKPNPAAGNQATTSLFLPPTLTILSPANGSSFQQGTTIGFAGNATVQTNGDISSYITWKEGATTLGTGSSFGLSSLGAGTHTIMVSVTDANSNLTTTQTLTVIITALPTPGVSPHDKFNGSTDQCAICHRQHAAQEAGSGAQINSTLSPNDLCLSCHNTDKVVVSTHSNADWVTAGGGNPRFEAQFELQCIQCHNPHGHDTSNNANLNNMRANLRLNTTVLTPTDPEAVDQFLSTGPVTFTALTGTNSFDDGASAATARLCLACHNNSSNPGYPMSAHPGAANHGDGNGNYNQNNFVGKDCTTCHPHSLDSTTTTRDGFSTTCRACHSMAQKRTSVAGTPARRQIVATFGQSPATSGDFVDRAADGSHHVAGNDAVTDADCLVCHEMTQHKQGTVRVFNEDTGSVLALDYTRMYPYVLGANDAANYETFCLSCHDANGKNGNTTPFSDKKLIPQIDTSLWSNSQHNVLKTGFNASCLDCHSNGHGSNKTYLQSKFSTATPWDWAYTGAGASPADVMDQEEDFCYKCHTTGQPGINAAGTNNIQLAFTTAANANISGGTPLSYGYRQHNIAATYNVHVSKEVFSALFGGANRHIECDDCHGPHKDKAGTSTAPTIKPENLGPTGVDPVYSGAGAPQKYNFVSQVTNEYQVCFKCHSSYTTLPTYTPYGWGCTGNPCAARALVPDGLRKLTRTANGQVQDTRDLARAFNPSNGSFHPVMAVGKNTAIAVASFVNGYTVNSRVYCTDCHTDPNNATQGNGPHGSPLLHILTGTTEYSTVSQTGRNVEPTVPNTEVCFRCHAYATYVQNGSTANTHFQDGSNLHYRHMTNGQITGTTCYTCHNSHGGNNQHLINFDTSVVTPNAGYNSETAWYQNGTNYSCNLACHGRNHNPVSYTP